MADLWTWNLVNAQQSQHEIATCQRTGNLVSEYLCGVVIVVMESNCGYGLRDFGLYARKCHCRVADGKEHRRQKIIAAKNRWPASHSSK